MEEIISDDKDDSYWLTWKTNVGLEPEYPVTPQQERGDINVYSDRTPRQQVDSPSEVEQNGAVSHSVVGGLYVPNQAGVSVPPNSLCSPLDRIADGLCLFKPGSGMSSVPQWCMREDTDP